MLDEYRPKARKPVAYTLDDHPNLLLGPMRPVFDGLRKELLALDPCVSEEFLKLYVAYKAETNFVDVVPQARGCSDHQHRLSRVAGSTGAGQGRDQPGPLG